MIYLTQEILNKLAEPFDLDEIYFLPSGTGSTSTMQIAAAYADKRAYAERMDSVLGPDSWQVTISCSIGPYKKLENDWDNKTPDGKPGKKMTEGSKVLVVAEVSVKIGEEWVVKSSSGAADMSDDNSITTAEAQAVKRAISMWGPGKYFYQLGRMEAPYNKTSKKFTAEPSLPDWAVPKYDCEDCKKVIKTHEWVDKNSVHKSMSIKDIIERSKQTYNAKLCAVCQNERRTTPKEVDLRLA
jgi:hypothetical protein